MNKIELAEKYPYEFTIQYPPRPEYFKNNFSASKGVIAELEAYEEILLYYHIPFCAQRCHYCDFSIDTRKSQDVQEAYVNALLTQNDYFKDIFKPKKLKGIDIGGGTPTILSIELLERLFKEICILKKMHNCQVSIETTPYIAALQPEKLSLLKEYGVDRVSVGIQTTSKKSLSRINRRLQRDLNEKALGNCIQAGFSRISIDLIFGIPDQSEDDWLDDISQATDLGATSITTYDCLYRGINRNIEKMGIKAPTPSYYRKLYNIGYEALLKKGYNGNYASLNFSRITGETGTSDYFEGRMLRGIPYIGLGNYATSLVGDVWSFNTNRVDDYINELNAGNKLPTDSIYNLPSLEKAAKYTIGSLNYGIIDTDYFRNATKLDFESTFSNEIEVMLQKGFIERTGKIFRIAQDRFDILPCVRALFYTDGAFEHLKNCKR